MVAPAGFDAPPLRVLVHGADALARRGLVATLAAVREVDVVGDGLPGAATIPAEVALWDVTGAADRFRARPAVALVVDDAGAADAWRVGARGLVWRDAGLERVVNALFAVHSGLVVIEEGLAQGVFSRTAGAGAGLSPREREVLALLADGLSNKLVAAHLDISEHTAKAHVDTIFRKLGATTRTEAVVKAMRGGLLTV